VKGENYVVRKFVFRGPSCVFICCVKLKVTVPCRLCYISPHISFADIYCNVLVREISGLNRGILKALDFLTT